MKIAIINDTHAGLKNGSDIFMNHLEQFYSEVFFPYCQRHAIKEVLHLGDYFDHRKYVNYKVLEHSRRSFLIPLSKQGMRMTIIPGNHDLYYNNNSSICGLSEIMPHFERNVRLILKPEVIRLGNLDIAMLPWINSENLEESLGFIQSAAAPILAGHLALNGFAMIKGHTPVTGGMDPSLFRRFELVLSGHFHTKSNTGQIHYLGSQYEQTWSDLDDPKYFHVLDTDTRVLTAVVNPLKIFRKFTYDDLDRSSAFILGGLDSSLVTNTFIKVLVTHKTDSFLFDRYIDKITSMNPYDLKIIESLDDYLGENVSDLAISVEDTPRLLNSYIDSVETPLNKDKLKSMLHHLYVEAQSVGTI